MSVSSTKVTKNSCITHKKQEKYTFSHFFLAKILWYQKKAVILHPLSREKVSGLTHNAAIAQLVEHDLAKVGVASSSLVCRSKSRTLFLLFYSKSPGGGIGRRVRFRCVCREACRFESCSGHYCLESKRVLKHSGKTLHTNWENIGSCGLTKERLRGC